MTSGWFFWLTLYTRSSCVIKLTAISRRILIVRKFVPVYLENDDQTESHRQ